MILFPHGYGKLIHDPAVHTVKVVLSVLSDESQIDHGQIFIAKQVFQDDPHKKFHRGRRRKSGTIGDISIHQHIKAFFHRIALFLKGPDDPLWIIGPSGAVPVYKVVKACLYNTHLTEIFRIETDLSVRSFSRHTVGANGQSTGKYMASVIVRMFTDKIHSAWRKVKTNVSSLSEKFLKLFY